MLVTLPFLLLVLDYWPLGRMGPAAATADGKQETAKFPRQPLVRLLVEKIPFLGLTIAFSAIAFFAQQRAGTVSSLAQRTLQTRVSNATVAYVEYLRMTFWPSDLAIFYPYAEQGIPARKVALAGGVLLACTAVALFQFRRRPYLIVGWLWYLGTLVPVIGFVQIGLQRMADRYTYVPIVGIFIAVTWWLPSLFEFAAWRRVILPVAGTAVLVACAMLGHAQVEHWRNSETLFAHAVEVTQSNAVAHNFLGEALLAGDDATGALEQFDAALAIQPNFTLAVFNRARALEALGRRAEAIAALETAVELDPSHAGHTVLADAYRDAGRVDDAIATYRAALEINPRYATALTNLANVLRDRGELEEAVRYYRRSLDADPNNVITHSNLGTTLLKLGQTDDGLLHLRQAVHIDAEHLVSRINLGIALYSVGDYAGAIEQLEQALVIDPGNATATQMLAEARRKLEPTGLQR
jgi:tetratricopeptide (TPR) repeat protein